MRRHAKASSAGSTSGTGNSRARFGRAFATRGASSDFDGSGAPSRRRLTVLGVALAAVMMLVLAPASASAVSPKGVTGFFGGSGAGNGQLNSPSGAAVNQSNGNVYVADTTNHRVEVFSSSGAFLRAFGQDVVESGPGNNGTGYEICVAANGDVCKAGITTASTGGAMQSPQGIAVDGSGNVYLSEQNKLRVQKFDAGGNFLLAFGRNVVATGPDNSGVSEIQSVVVKATSGTFTLSYGGQSTSPVAFNASATTVEAALNALTGIGGIGGSVSVSGGPGDATGSTPYAVTFGGSLAGTNVAQITVNTSGLGVGAGTVLNCAGGPVSGVTLSYQWIANGASLGSANGAQTSAYTVQVADAGKVIQCKVTATNSPTPNAGSTQVSAPSLAGEIVASAYPAAAPPTTALSTLAAVTGNGSSTPFVCKAGAWDGNPTSYTYRWYRNGAQIAGSETTTSATESKFTPTAGELATPAAFQCQVIATNAGGSATLISPNKNTAPAPSPAAPTATSTVSALSSSSTSAEGIDAFEVCTASAGDLCQAGVEGSIGGAFKGAFNGRLTIAPGGSPNAGDILVADPGNARVQEFTSAGAFVRAFGFDVETGGVTTFEVCVVGANCKAGAAGSGSGQFAAATPTEIAEDASGNIYTVEPTTTFRVQKFTLPANIPTPGGVFSEANLKGTSSSGATQNNPLNLAIDPATSDLLVTKVFPAGATPSCPSTGAASAQERRVVEVSPAGALEATHMACAGVNVGNGLAVRTSTGDVYVSSTTEESRLYVLNTGMLAPTVGFSGVSGINAHGANISGFVNPNGPGGLAYGLHTTYHVAFKRSADSTFSNAPASDLDAGHGINNVVVSQQLIGLEANTSYDVQIVAIKPFGNGNASTSTFTFSTSAVGAEVSAPTVTAAADDTDVTAAFYGTVSPNNQPTTYRFEYGPTSSYGSSVPVPNGSAGSGASTTPVAEHATALQPSTTYHFRLIASNASGADVSSDQTFTTPPLGGGLPDNRGFEQVSPSDKRPAGEMNTFDAAKGLNYQASTSGDKVLYPILNGLADATSGGEVRYLASRGSSQWSSAQVSPPSLIPPVSVGASNAVGQVRYASADLSCQIVETFEPLTEDTPPEDADLGVVNLYRRNSDGSQTLITSTVPLNPASVIGSRYTVDFASSDCSHILFESNYRFLPDAPASGAVLYEWANGTLRLAGVLPDGSIVAAGAGAAGRSTLNTVSPDGSRIFFVATAPGKQAVFVRKNGTTTVEASKSQTAIPNNSSINYQLASGDGSHVFFTARYGLTANSSTGATTCNSGEGCDLYDYNVDTEVLTNRSVDVNPADPKGAGVVGLIDASDDGAYVYFAARGQLVPNRGKTYAQNVSGGFVNLYLNHDGDLSFVGTISSASGGNNLPAEFGTWAADATPSGKHLLFVSNSNVAGYVSGGATEAYRYSADADNVVCVSCRVDGLPSLGTSATAPIGVMRKLEWGGTTGNTPAHRPRSISDDGSYVFFTMPDVLAPGGIAQANNVYEWHDGSVHLIAAGEGGSIQDFTLFVDSSADGADAFVKTKAKLAPQDFDTTSDLFDARIGGGFPFVPPPTPCNPAADECQAPPSTQPLPAVGSASEAMSGPGNPPVAVKKPKKKRVKKHHGKVKKHHGKSHKRGAKRTAHRGSAR